MNTSRSCAPKAEYRLVGCAGWHPLYCCDIKLISDEVGSLLTKKGGNAGIAVLVLSGMGAVFVFNVCFGYEAKQAVSLVNFSGIESLKMQKGVRS